MRTECAFEGVPGRKKNHKRYTKSLILWFLNQMIPQITDLILFKNILDI